MGGEVRIKAHIIPGHFLLPAVLLVLVACVSPAEVSAPAPVLENRPVETIIVETAAAARTQTAQSLPPTQTASSTPTQTRTPTQTPIPTNTVLFLIPTKTQVILPTFTLLVPGSGGGKPTKTPNPNTHDYTGTLRCAVVGQTPSDGTIFSRREKFTMVWTVKNTGTAAWRKHIIDYRYIGGDKFHNKERYNMNFIVDPGETIDMEVEMVAPKEPGNYKTTWVVGLNKGGICKMTLFIVIK